jgi:cullin-associated NEDD8-dissociated protein 1
MLSAAGGEDIKHYAAVSLGNVALGSLSYYMPVILEQIRGKGKQIYLLLLSLREVIAKGAFPTCAHYADLSGYSKEIWTLLFDIVVIPELEEGTRNVIAECLGRLCAGNPEQFLDEMVGMVKSKASPVARATVVSAIRFTLALTDTVAASSGFEQMLAPVLVEFIKCIQDEELVCCDFGIMC